MKKVGASLLSDAPTEVLPEMEERCALETQRNVECDNPWVCRKDVGAQPGIVAVEEEIGDRRVVEDVFHLKLEGQIGLGSGKRHR